jgi:succinyl-CoA synthetase beta subunit
MTPSDAPSNLNAIALRLREILKRFGLQGTQVQIFRETLSPFYQEYWTADLSLTESVEVTQEFYDQIAELGMTLDDEGVHVTLRLAS